MVVTKMTETQMVGIVAIVMVFFLYPVVYHMYSDSLEINQTNLKKLVYMDVNSSASPAVRISITPSITTTSRGTSMQPPNHTACQEFINKFSVNFIYINGLTHGPGFAQQESVDALKASRLRVSQNAKSYFHYAVNMVTCGYVSETTNLFYGRAADVKAALACNHTNWTFVVGPNFIPGDPGADPDQNSLLSNVYHVAPAHWVYDTWVHERHWKQVLGILPNPLHDNSSSVQPATNHTQRTECILYFKRSNRLVPAMEQMITQLHLNIYCQQFRYGSYKQADFIKAAKTSRYAIISDGTETQGYAIEQLMLHDVPLFILEENYAYFNKTGMSKVAPWFEDGGTGVVYSPDDKLQASQVIEDMTHHFLKFVQLLHTYRPREYILNTLSRTRFVRNFIRLICDRCQSLPGCDIYLTWETETREKCLQYVSEDDVQ